MLLWKWYLRYRYKRTLRLEEKQRSFETERERCVTLLQEITESQFALYEVTHGSAVTLSVPDRDINTYIERIRRIQRIIKQNQALNPSDFGWSLQEVTVDQFFISSKGYYQDVEKAVTRLKEAALALCEESAKTDHVEYGVDEHNGRLLTKLFINLQNLSKVLIDVSLTN